MTTGGITAANEVAPASARTLADRLRDVRLWAAMLGVAMQPISTATGNIGFVIALVAAVPRIPAEMQALRSLWRQPWLPWLVAWVLLTWSSLLWSPDPSFGREQFKASRVLLWLPLLWPVRNHWRQLVAAMLAGTTLMVLIQASQMAFGWPVGRWHPGYGLTTPTQTGLWAAVALSFWLILVVAAPPRKAILTVPIAMLTGVALVWSATRASVVGLMVELVFANVMLAVMSPGWFRRALLRGLVGIAILIGAMLVAPRELNAKVRQALSETDAALSGRRAESDQDRLAMWRMAIDGWWHQGGRAIGLGLGAGCVPSIASKTTIQVARGDLTKTTMIHSTYLQTLVETGAAGLCLLLAFVMLVLREAFRSVQRHPLQIAGFGALIVWFVAAGFDGYQQSGGLLSVGAILIPLALADLRKPPGALA